MFRFLRLPTVTIACIASRNYVARFSLGNPLRFKGSNREVGVRFHTIVLADGTRIPIATEPIYRDGEAPGNSSSAKIGGAAVGGAILGAILGGSKGMAIGAAAGAGAGTAAVAAGDRNAATLAAGSPLTVRLLQPVTVTIDSKN